LIGSSLPLLDAVTALAFGRRMDSDALRAFYSAQGVGPQEQGGNKPDSNDLVPKFDVALNAILAAAREGALTIFARPPRHDLREAGRYPRGFRSPEPIPPAAFIANYHFGPDPPPVLWIEGEPPFQAEWFHPCLSESEFDNWRAITSGRKVDERCMGAAENRGRRPTKRDAIIAKMRRAIEEGPLTPASLEGMLEKTLATDYGVSRDTARKARRTVLGDIVGKSIPDK
jgi:hypothetical protein